MNLKILQIHLNWTKLDFWLTSDWMGSEKTDGQFKCKRSIKNITIIA